MRLLGIVLFCWTAASMGAAVVLGRVLRAVPPMPSPVVDPVDWLADAPVDVWSDVRVDAEFAAIVAPYEVTP